MITFSELSSITGGSIIQQASELPIKHLLLDSRKLLGGAHSLFFAIKGQRHDGHQFIASVYEQGVRQFVVEQGDQTTYQHLKNTNVIRVTSSQDALQQLAAYHRKQHFLPLLAITGSNGKTIVKEWISQLLALVCSVIKSPKSYNSQIGVPLSVWQINEAYEYGIFEAGISLPGEMTQLAAILEPTMGLFTNIGPAHDEGFLTRQQKLQEKALLFSYCNKIYYCFDHAPIHQVLTALYQGKKQLVSWTWRDDGAVYKVQKQLRSSTQQTQLSVVAPEQEYIFTLPFQDTASIENAVHCIVFLLHQGFSSAMLQEGLMKLRAVPMRLTLKKGISNCQLVDDTYNNDLAGLQVALDFIHQQKKLTKKTVILSDLLQTGTTTSELYAQVAQQLKNKQVTRLIGVGPAITAHAEIFKDFEAQCYPCTAALLEKNLQHQFSNELILVKGARSFGLEKIVDRLLQKVHCTVLEVDLDAVSHNLNFFRAKLAQHTQLMVMVKSLAYGSSSFEIAQLLQYHRVEYLAVAYADEGVLLRENGISLPIMVMNPTPGSFEKLLAYNLEPEVYSLKLLYELRHFLTNRKKPMSIHLKLETGMHRLGLEESEVSTLLQVLRNTSVFNVASIMSHLAAASDAQHDTYTKCQFSLFMKMALHIEKSLGISTIKHLLNTAGIQRFPDYQLDMVRLGIGLYGIGLDKETQKHLKVASTLKTIVSQIKQIPQGATVGYGREGIAKNEMKIATIAIGYADGFSRILGNGKGSVWIKGHLAPVVGNVCMDMSMVDVTDIPVNEGDEVIVFGQELSIAEVAQSMNTIPYEVLTNVSERVERVYYAN